MCTLSWCARSLADGGGYHLFFNRDEQRDREPASPPEIVSGDSHSYITARDGRAGGTWLLANDCGLSVAILNHYDATITAPKIQKAESRGKLVIDLGQCTTIAEFREQLSTLAPKGRYRPFLIFAIAPDLDSSLWCWDGHDCREQRVPEPELLTTSSFQSEDVITHRLGLRTALPSPVDPADLRKMHECHDPNRPAHSIRMRRDDAMTISLCELEIGSGQACYRYRPEPAEGLQLSAATELCLPLLNSIS